MCIFVLCCPLLCSSIKYLALLLYTLLHTSVLCAMCYVVLLAVLVLCCAVLCPAVTSFSKETSVDNK